MEFSTCDFCDRFKSDESGRLRVLPGVYRSYGPWAASPGLFAR